MNFKSDLAGADHAVAGMTALGKTQAAFEVVQPAV